MVDGQFQRTALLIGDAGVATLAAKRVCVFGVGGVGGAVVEGLARAGVGALDLVDSDTVEASNINRQFVALHSTIGEAKVDVAAKRIADINPACRVTRHRFFYLPETANRIDFGAYDYVVDAVDTVTAKLRIVEEAERRGTPVISAMGAGNKLDPARFRVADVYDTRVCPLAKIIRKECRKRGIDSLKVVFSDEPPLPGGAGGVPGSVPFVPPVMGFIMAAEVVRDLLAQPAE